jgi:hypothetical protein
VCRLQLRAAHASLFKQFTELFENSPCAELLMQGFRRLRTATKAPAFVNRKPLKRLDLNYNLLGGN